MEVRSALRQITPPVVASGWRKFRERSHPRPPPWGYLGEEWVDDDGSGWDAPGVVAAYRAKLPEFRRMIAAPASIGVPTEAGSGLHAAQYHQNVALEYAYAVARASAGRERISILDWGGGFGFMAFVVAELFPELVVDFHVKELPSIARAARELVPEVTFWDDESCLERQFDLVTASSSLQYEPEWATAIGRLGRAGRSLMLSRLPVSTGSASFVVRQRAYDTSYVGWVISRDELIAAGAKAGFELAREFLEGWSAPVPDAPHRDEHRGFLFDTSIGRKSVT